MCDTGLAARLRIELPIAVVIVDREGTIVTRDAEWLGPDGDWVEGRNSVLTWIERLLAE